VEIVESKVGAGTVTLSMAWSASKFAESVLKALNGESGIVEVAYVKSDVSKTKYFSNPLKLGVLSRTSLIICFSYIFLKYSNFKVCFL